MQLKAVEVRESLRPLFRLFLELRQTEHTNWVAPHTLDGEQAVLGSMLIEETAVVRAAEILDTPDFYRTAHRYIFAAMLALAERDAPIDLITLADELKARQELELVGGHLYLQNLMEAPSTAANIEHYSRGVREKANREWLMRACYWAFQVAKERQDDVALDELRDALEAALLGVDDAGGSASFRPIGPVVAESLERLYSREAQAGVTGVRTHLPDMDFMLGGLQPADLILIAGRPGMGKSSLGMQFAMEPALRDGVPIAVFSLEMTAEQIAGRMLCNLARVDSHCLLSGVVSIEESKRLAEAAKRLQDVPIYVDATRDLSVRDLATRCRRLHRDVGIGMVVIDYLQQLRHAGSVTTDGGRNAEVGEIARSLKSLARELNVPVLALSQLSRGVESRPDKKPLLSDLRDSGMLEQESDLIFLLFRAAYYKRDKDERDPAEIEKAEIIIAKNRNGRTGSVEVGWIGKYLRFECLEEDRSPSSPYEGMRQPPDPDIASATAPVSREEGDSASLVDSFLGDEEQDPFADSEAEYQEYLAAQQRAESNTFSA